ncbi:hypothetical protein [Nocardioides baculatus]|uniref:Uncharacterized protein n=1 Tax=Nocardioides baculatus TaxID=2801337 RepID=A0ABS1L396_9ACTN|nr:hypothetical protein [Nocardioides baculatus]MBL0746174.1 hypothetical protein [Nocardioides baculatus]
MSAREDRTAQDAVSVLGRAGVPQLGAHIRAVPHAVQDLGADQAIDLLVGEPFGEQLAAESDDALEVAGGR